MIGLIPAGTLPVFAVEATEHNHDEGVSVTCTCGTEDESIHATDCPAYVAPETAVCTCVEQCTEGNANVWCDVCGFDASACTGTDTAAVYDTTTYPLKIAGVEVTSDNCTAITDDAISGTVSYDPTTNTLTLNGATITSAWYYIISYTGTEDFTINLVGENKLTTNAANASCIAADSAKIIISGGGSLTATGGSFSIGINVSELEINNTTVTAIGGNNGIYAKNLTVSGSTVNATATAEYGSGIYGQSDGTITIENGSKVTVASESGYGIQSSGSFSISGSTLTASGAYGLYCSGATTITNSTVKATATTKYGWANLGNATASISGTSHILASGGEVNWIYESCTLNLPESTYYWRNSADGDFTVSTQAEATESNVKTTYFELYTEGHAAYTPNDDGTTHSLGCPDGCAVNTISSGTSEAHTWEDGECKVCGATCDHGGETPTYANGVCNECGASCTHSGNTDTDDGDCTTEVLCSVCGGVATAAQTSHNFSGSDCQNAGCTVKAISIGTVMVEDWNGDGDAPLGAANGAWTVDEETGLITSATHNMSLYVSSDKGDQYTAEDVRFQLTDGVWTLVSDDAAVLYEGDNSTQKFAATYPFHRISLSNPWLTMSNIPLAPETDGQFAIQEKLLCYGDVGNSEINIQFKHVYAALSFNVTLAGEYKDATIETLTVTGLPDAVKQNIFTGEYDYTGVEFTGETKFENANYLHGLMLPYTSETPLTYGVTVEFTDGTTYETTFQPSRDDGSIINYGFEAGYAYTINLQVGCDHVDENGDSAWVDGTCSVCGKVCDHGGENLTYTYAVAVDGKSITAPCDTCGAAVGTLSFVTEVEYDGHVLGLSNAVSATGIFVDLIAEESGREDEEKRFAMTSCHADTCFEKSADSTNETCKTAVGCKNAGTHSLTLTFTDGANSYEITDTVTVTPKALTITEIYYEKIYDGTTTVVPNSVSFSGEVEYKYLNWGYEYTYFDDVEVNVELVTFPDSVPGTYTTVHLSGITLSGNSAGNYYISEEMDLTGEFVIEQIELTIKPVDQIIAQGSAPDPTKFTVTNSNYETVTGLTIEGVEITAEGDTLYINTKNVTIKQGDTDVTAYYNINNGGEDDSYYTANASWACPNHTFNTDGFCATGGCTLYEPATLVNGTDEWGNPMEVYEISNAGQLYWFAEQVNNGNTYINGRLKNNITVNTTLDENARIWTPIGSEYRPYTGSFDGQGYTISGLYFNDENAKFVGLFGRTGYNYTIQHLALSNSYFKGSDYVGGLIGNAETILSNCYVTDSVTVEGSQNTGLLVGSNGGTITNCYAPGVLTGGGYGSYENCYYIGEDDGYDGTIAVTIEQMKSGEVAYHLQSGIVGEEVYDEETDSWVTQAPDEVWGQTIGTEDYPVFGGAKVYQRQNCNGETLYRNIDEDVTHNYGELIPATEEVHTETELKAAVAAHYYCSECQGYFTEDYTPTTLDELTGEAPTHTFGDEWQTGDGQHWKECFCGAQSELAVHTYDATTHTCVCGDVEKIVSVTITWGAMSFTYDDALDAEGNEKGWICDDGANVITIENTGNTDITVTYTYEQVRTEIEGSFTDGTNTVTKMTILATEKKSVWLILKNKPTAALTDAHLGTVKLTIE